MTQEVGKNTFFDLPDEKLTILTFLCLCGRRLRLPKAMNRRKARIRCKCKRIWKCHNTNYLNIVSPAADKGFQVQTETRTLQVVTE